MTLAALDDRAAPSAMRESTNLTFAVARDAAIATLLPEWAALSTRTAGDNLFFRSEFAVAAMRHVGRSVAIATVARPDGRLVALAPFTETRLGRIGPAVRLWAHDYAPLGLPLIDQRGIDPAVNGLIEGLAPSDSGVSLIVPDLPLDSSVAEAFRNVAHRENRPVDILDGHSRAMLARSHDGAGDRRAALPARRRKEFGRQMRRLTDMGTVTIEACVEPARVRSRFEIFMTLEAAGWKGKHGTALISSTATADFAREAVVALADIGAVRIDSINVDGQPIAMVVSFTAGATAFTWKVAYDETYARFSPGAQLMLDVPNGIFSDRTVGAIDSCAAADHPMIDHLWDGRLAIGTMVIGPPGGSVLHKLGLAATKAEVAARATVRRLRA